MFVSLLACHLLASICSTFSKDTCDFTLLPCLLCSLSQMSFSFFSWQTRTPLLLSFKSHCELFWEPQDVYSGSCPPRKNFQWSSLNLPLKASCSIPHHFMSFLRISVSLASRGDPHPGKVLGVCWLKAYITFGAGKENKAPNLLVFEKDISKECIRVSICMALDPTNVSKIGPKSFSKMGWF